VAENQEKFWKKKRKRTWKKRRRTRESLRSVEFQSFRAIFWPISPVAWQILTVLSRYALIVSKCQIACKD